MSDSDVALTKAELAQRLRVSSRTVQRMMHEEGLPFVELSERRPRFLWADVLAWLRSRKAAA